LVKDALFGPFSRIRFRHVMADDVRPKVLAHSPKHIQIRNGGTIKVTNTCSTAVNIQTNKNQCARFASDRNIRHNKRGMIVEPTWLTTIELMMFT